MTEKEAKVNTLIVSEFEFVLYKAVAIEESTDLCEAA
jgi:hypothetical protein